MESSEEALANYPLEYVFSWLTKKPVSMTTTLESGQRR